ncbi:hypothetical protein H8A95_09150 [Bradyrhizobium sp. Pear76]|uniref:hypothetical protein n=1 Tax=Bradyrhizobium oropedii TaxID=1571201 RepID=UPI001E49D7AD|nr:hypothetical protein [Bradyrhizobium oropedii]MCC8962475.1 hypothetical protein [Bradyrhizobium oropedii]
MTSAPQSRVVSAVVLANGCLQIVVEPPPYATHMQIARAEQALSQAIGCAVDVVTPTILQNRLKSAIRDTVFHELDAAGENGYPLDRWTAEAIAEDLTRCSPALDGGDPKELLPLVREWMAKKPCRFA